MEKQAKEMTGIYQIRNSINGKCYIGSAVDIKGRLTGHVLSLKQKSHYNKYLQNAWNKYGEKSFKFEVLLYCNKQDLLFYEQRAIDTYQAANGGGYNLSPTAGSPLGVKRSKETRRKYSLSHLGSKNYMYGRAHSQEAKEKIKKARAKQIHPLLGKSHSEETKRKISEARKRFYDDGLRSEEARKAVSNSNKKRIVSEDTKEKRNASLKSFYSSNQSERAREKIREANSNYIFLRDDHGRFSGKVKARRK